MTRPVSYETDQLLRFSFFTTELFIHLPAKLAHQCNICPLVMSADIVRFTDLSFMIDQVDRPYMIFYKKPIAHIFAFAINRQRFIVEDIMNTKRYQFFG